jgi:mRNA-degrading endonuclease RelE of RelBE toxin-antitoxin system
MPSDPLLIEIALTPRFQKDLRDLVKRYRSIRKDLQTLQDIEIGQQRYQQMIEYRESQLPEDNSHD